MKFGILRERVHQTEELFSPDELLRIKERYEDSYKLKVQISEFSPMHNTETLELKFQMTSVIVMFYLS
jgi:hypothetical protein